jgi:hypothetical protein
MTEENGKKLDIDENRKQSNPCKDYHVVFSTPSTNVDLVDSSSVVHRIEKAVEQVRKEKIARMKVFKINEEEYEAVSKLVKENNLSWTQAVSYVKITPPLESAQARRITQ